MRKDELRQQVRQTKRRFSQQQLAELSLLVVERLQGSFFGEGEKLRSAVLNLAQREVFVIRERRISVKLQRTVSYRRLLCLALVKFYKSQLSSLQFARDRIYPCGETVETAHTNEKQFIRTQVTSAGFVNADGSNICSVRIRICFEAQIFLAPLTYGIYRREFECLVAEEFLVCRQRFRSDAGTQNVELIRFSRYIR